MVLVRDSSGGYGQEVVLNVVVFVVVSEVVSVDNRHVVSVVRDEL